MTEKASSSAARHSKKAAQTGSAGGLWFAGFIGALVYFIHFHSGTFWLVVLAFIKALFWPSVLVYHLLLTMHV